MTSSVEERIAAIAAVEYAKEERRIREAITRARQVRLVKPQNEGSVATLDRIPKNVRKQSTSTSSSAFPERNAYLDRGAIHKNASATRSGDRSPRKTSASSGTTSTTVPIGPEWYQKLGRTGNRNPRKSNEDIKLASLKECIRACKSSPHADHTSQFNQIRANLHSIAFLTVTPQMLREQFMLHPGSGLPQLFMPAHRGDVDWPFDIRADAEELYNKWYRGVFETDIMHGLIPGQAKKKGRNGEADTEMTATRLDKTYAGRVPANYHGAGKLVNGQWWPIWMAALRDGAHGHAMAGIHGHPDHGAYSCILSAGREYNDEDYGDWLWYCGTDSKNGQPTEGTKWLLQSESDQTPIRLLRSSEAAWKSEWAPKRGLRYDGLYKITEHERVGPENSVEQRHRFRLERLPGQDPIRSQGPEERPTREELEAYDNDKRARGL